MNIRTGMRGVLVVVGLLALVFATLSVKPRPSVVQASLPSRDSRDTAYPRFYETAEQYLSFLPTDLRRVYPESNELSAEFTAFPEILGDARGIDTLAGEPLMPTRFDFRYLSDSDVLVQMHVVYAPWSNKDQVIYWTHIHSGLLPENSDWHVPYVLEGLIGRKGHLIHFTITSLTSSTSEEVVMVRVGRVYDKFVKELNQFMSPYHLNERRAQP